MMDRVCPQCKRGDLVERLNKKTGRVQVEGADRT
jgi:hypothetical protein